MKTGALIGERVRGKGGGGNQNELKYKKITTELEWKYMGQLGGILNP